MLLPLRALALPLLLLAQGAEPPAGSPAAAATVAARPPAPPAPFEEVPGVRRLSGRMLVRPLQVEALLRAGASRAAAWELRAEARRLVREYELVRRVDATDEYVLRVPAGSSAQRECTRLVSSGLFEYAEPDWLLSPAAQQGGAQGAPFPGPPSAPATRPGAPAGGALAPPVHPDDPFFPLQWHHSLARLGSPLAWGLEQGSPAIAVAVCDTGLRLTHEDLQHDRLEGYNAVDREWESEGGAITPVYYHGTRTTGVVAAAGDNGLGVAGVAWGVSHRMVRVSNISTGNAYLSDLQHGARTAIERGDRVANVSYHGAASASNPTTASYIRSLGGILLWSAGNTGANYSVWDRDDDDMIVVGATDQSDALATFSVYGRFVDLVAPGVAIYTTDSGFDADYAAPEGTSYACPMTSGVCALIWSARPRLSPADVEAILKASCVDLGAAGVDDTFGYGRIDLITALRTPGEAPPQADFAAPALSGVSPLTVAFRDLSTGVPSSWTWDFGDGSTSSAQNPQHTYTSSGLFTVTLTAHNRLGSDTAVRSDYVVVDVLPPVADFTAAPTGGLSPLAVQFTDTSTGGHPTSWLWDFGDGATATQQHPSHVYTASGTYTVSLTADNPYGSDQLVRADYVAVDFIPPVAAFSATPTSGNSPYVVHFTDESVGGVATGWLWSFGDGGSSTAQHPDHTYTAEGTYSVRLTASNAWGSDELLKTGYVVVGPGPPVLADFTATPTSGAAPLTVQFTDLSIGSVTEWVWEFDDGPSSNLRNPSHTFTSPGEYNISLEVSDADGTNDQLQREAYIVVN